jgi:hypothetical protein
MQRLFRPLRALSFLVLALLIVAALYAAYISLKYWGPIAV